ncbi:MAG: 4-hydroxythreonine-4-phosphate dehydrogenase, partial [Candidatus Puniceispirillum sp.]
MLQKPIILTPGDPAGIGAEISLKAWQQGCNDFVIFENAARLQSLANNLGMDIAITSLPHL